MNTSRWVDDRLASLDLPGWHPNADRALGQLRRRERSWRRRRAGFLWGGLATLAAAASLLVISPPQACAKPNGCADQRPAAPPRAVNFKEQGSPSATVTIEIYTDYECPTCAMLYRDFMPTLVEQYVKTGKVKVLHRDFPLPQHQFSRLAARYANAAGRLGYYDAAVNQIFKTQAQWQDNGKVDEQLIAVLPPGVMQQVREMVKSDNTLDATVEADVAMVRTDNINQTPTLIVVTKGKRQPVVGIPRWDLFKSYLDGLLGH